MKICLVAHSAYSAIAVENIKHIGGIERQTWLMARWFASHGYHPSILTWDEGQEDGIEIDGVRILKMCRQDAGLPFIRFFSPRWRSLIFAMRRADADVYYYNCGDLGLGQVVMWCRQNNKKSVYSVANDPDCNPDLPMLKSLRERLLYRYGLKHVDSIIVQTQRQQKMLKKGFGINSTVIPMPCEEFNTNTNFCLRKKEENSANVVWIGRISEQKRFEWLLNIAELCPKITFDVLGSPNRSSTYATALIKRAAGLDNVKMHGNIPHAEIVEYLMRATVLCCTSIYEGFPNTFLEAWSCGLPVVSTFDPDDVISINNLGWTASSIDGLVSAIRESVKDSKKWDEASEAARKYYMENHTLDSCMKQFDRVIKGAIQL